MSRTETVPGGQAIYQSDTAKTYKCPACRRPIFSQYEGDELPEISCGVGGGHTLRWPAA